MLSNMKSSENINKLIHSGMGGERGQKTVSLRERLNIQSCMLPVHINVVLLYQY